MKKLLLTMLALVFAGGIAFGETIRMGTEGAYPPYNFINDSGEIDGFERELGDELCKRTKLTCIWVTNEWDSIIPNLVSGNYDTIIAGMSITSEREKAIDFTENYTHPDPSVYLALSPDVDLEGGVIAAQTSTIQAAYIAEMGAILIEFSSPDEMIAAVRNGEADAVLADKSFLAPIAKESSDLMMVGKSVLIGGGVGIGVRKSDTALKYKLTKAIQSMKKDGSLNKLIKKWLPESDLF